MKTVSVDFTNRALSIKPLHGVNNSPPTYGEKIPAFEQAGIPYVRLHDTMGAYGGTCFVDVPNLFPNFDADENDPASYTFEFTDAYLRGLVASGCQIFYRLGVTIENQYRIRRMHTDPPKDFAKWARICEHIVAHYTEGWANGQTYPITYWEIWNEPENPPMWSGTMEAYFDLYRVTANHLKRRFPNIKVGGYASCGFYCVTRKDMGEFYESFLTWFDRFLEAMSDPETGAPIDFFSWHLYTDDPLEIAAHARYVSEKLYEYGYHDTESIFNEWNYISQNDTRFDDMKTIVGAAFVGAAFSLMQYGSIDKAMYYDAYPQRSYCGLFAFPSGKPTKTYYAFQAFNELYRLGRCHPASSEANGLFPIAASNEAEQAVLLTAFDSDETYVMLDMNGLNPGMKKCALYRLDEQNNLTLERTEFLCGERVQLIPRMDRHGLLLIRIQPAE